MRKFVVVGAIAGTILGMAWGVRAAPAKIGMDKARQIALQLAPGDIVKAEYERENGGWRYSFDIRQGDRIHEIGVDAFTGKVVENAFENANAHD